MMKRTLFVSLLILVFATLGLAQQTAQRIALTSSITATGDITGTDRVFPIKDVKEVTVALKIASADRTTGDETYDLYITTGITMPDGTKVKWDIAHFPQIAATGAKTYVACIKGYGSPYASTVTTAAPGVPAVVTGTMRTDTAGSDNGIKTLGAGLVRHGVLGEFIGYELVTAGTSPILAYQIAAVAK